MRLCNINAVWSSYYNKWSINSYCASDQFMFSFTRADIDFYLGFTPDLIVGSLDRGIELCLALAEDSHSILGFRAGLMTDIV